MGGQGLPRRVLVGDRRRDGRGLDRLEQLLGLGQCGASLVLSSWIDGGAHTPAPAHGPDPAHLDTMDDFLRQILDQPAWLIYLVVGVIVFVEDAIFVGFVVPGETAAVLGGVSAFLGRTDLTAMVLLVVVAAIVGDSVGYEVGKVWGSRVLSHRLLDKRRHQLERAQDFLRRRGGSAVFLGRWTAFFRAVMPALAGVSRMPYRRFLIWNAAGGIVWGVVVVVVGYLAGLSYDRAAAWLGGGATAVVAVIVIGALIVWHVRRRQREKALEHEPAGA